MYTCGMVYEQLLAQFPIISDQMERSELAVLLRKLELILQMGTTGNVVEFGCYSGTTALFITRLLKHYNSSAEYHVYDSFEGLPEKSPQDSSPAGEQFIAGELAVSKQQFIRNFKRARLPLPFIHKNWFGNLLPEEVPNDIIFAFLDGDFYDSVKTPLKFITPKLCLGAAIIVDDYLSESLPGARRAVDEWAHQHNKNITPAHSLAVIDW